VLTITPEALAVIRRVTDHPTLEPTSGVRIARRDDGSSELEVRAVHGPQPGDSVVERPGARLYLDPDAGRRVDGRRLDVLDPRGPVQFVLREAA
jgi:Fe-S cluster assembly iron-binding protein IscA